MPDNNTNEPKLVPPTSSVEQEHTDQSNSSETHLNEVPTSTAARKLKMNTTVVIFASILIALGLVSVGFLTYNSAEDAPSKIKFSPSDSAQEFDNSSPPTEEGLDNESKEIDATINEFENSDDFNNSELSEENLGY